MKKEFLEEMIRLRRRLHAHPELSMEERWTKQTLMDFLKEHTRLELVDRGHWFYAYYDCGKAGAKTYGFRADFDALPMEETLELPYGSRIPGVSHKCGHDGHSAALAGLALMVDAEGADKNVYFIFQHGEEIGGGGAECAGLIREKQIDRVFAFHNMSGCPQGSILVRDGIVQCASKGLTVRFAGTPAHASQPEDGKNPARAAAELVLAAEEAACQDHYPELVMATIVEVRVGHKNFGIAASEGEVSMTLRAARGQDLEQIEREIRDRAGKLACRDGLEVSFEERDVFPDTVNDPESVELVRQAANRCGFPVIEMKELFRGSEDFGYYLKACPGAIFYIGNGENYPQIHTSAYDFPDGILETAAEMFWELLRTEE